MPTLDQAALAVFLIAWIAYQPLLRVLSQRRGRTINSDLTVIRTAWMRNMAMRDIRLLDGQLIGNTMNSSSFFASTSLIMIAAVAGAMFGGDAAYRGLKAAPLLAAAPRFILEIKLGLIVLALGRALLDFIWAIRQLNYCLAIVGAAPPPDGPRDLLKAYGEAAASVMNPAFSAFNSGVRGYYFALAAAAWLIGPIAMMAAVVFAIALLIWRQLASRSAVGVTRIRELLETIEPGETLG